VKPIEVLDTTLRDGTQGEAIQLSVEDKLALARELAAFGVPLIEGGWPGSNPKDAELFRRMRGVQLGSSQLVAFGATRRKGLSAEEDPQVRALMEAETPVVSLVGKSWDFHVRQVLEVELDEHLAMIEETCRFLSSRGRRVIYDAEHFFDGFEANPTYALATLEAALRGGAETLCLCDTNGGSLPGEIRRGVQEVARRFPEVRLGIHPHNDSDLAVANALAAVEAGVTHVQGTINGYGERCGNLNLTSLIPNLVFKLGRELIGIPPEHLKQLRALSRLVDERANLPPNLRAPFVGDAAFAHKGGIHVAAVLKDPRTYEHLPPEEVGNTRRILVSELSGRGNLRLKLAELHLELSEAQLNALLQEVKEREHMGFAFEGAEASLYLLAHRLLGGALPFRLEGFSVVVHGEEREGVMGTTWAEATVRLRIGGELVHTAAESPYGPVSALDLAFRRAALEAFPELAPVELTDYKVRVLSGTLKGTASGVRVWVEMRKGASSWGTVGVSRNSLEASLWALTEGYAYALVRGLD
jgi:2-isopropylmalate synthase